MAGIIDFGRDKFWSAASWAFLEVRDFIDSQLAEDDAPTIKEQIAADRDSGLRVLTLDDLAPSERQVFCSVLDRMIAEYQRGLHMPTLSERERAAFIAHLKELRQTASCGS